MVKSLFRFNLIGVDGYLHGKQDQENVSNANQQAKTANDQRTNSGIDQTQNRINTLTPLADSQMNSIWSGYSGLAGDPGGGIDANAKARLLGMPTTDGSTSPYNPLATNGGSIPGGQNTSSSSGSGGGGGGGSANPGSYLDTWKEMQGATGGFDPSRLSAIGGDSNTLRNTASQYGDTNRSISGLQDFASTGGVSADNISKIDNPTLEEFSKTGGFNAQDLANVRARSNSALASNYANLQDNLQKQKLASGNIGPGWSNAGFKLARQGAQDQGTNATNTEVGLNNAVTQNRMAASSTLADKMQALSALQSQNTLSGYSDAGSLANTKQSQIDSATANAAGIDLGTQNTINNARLAATSGLSSDTLGRMQIGASSGAAQNALNAQIQMAKDRLNADNNQFLIGETDRNRNTGLSGMLGAYQANPTQLMQNQQQLFNYDQLGTQQGQNNVNNWMGYSNIPGITGDIGAGLGVVGQVAGMGAGLVSGMSGMGFGNNLPKQQLPANNWYGSYGTLAGGQ